jgi:hypothetical protein
MKHRHRSRQGCRAEIPAWELDRYLTRQLHKTPGFDSVSLSAGYRLRQTDEDGCNWSGAVVAMCGRATPEASTIAAALPPLVEAARARFNLKE